MANYPDECKQYYDVKRHELGLMKSVLKSLSPEAKQEMMDYYKKHGKIGNIKIGQG